MYSKQAKLEMHSFNIKHSGDKERREGGKNGLRQKGEAT
jgi:hypothetical protein